MALLGRPTDELRYQKAWMLVQFANNYQALGNTVKWRERAIAAQQLLTELSQRDPDNVFYLRDLAIADSTLGDALFQQALTIRDHLAKVDRKNLSGSEISLSPTDELDWRWPNKGRSRKGWPNSGRVRPRSPSSKSNLPPTPPSLRTSPGLTT